MISQPVGTWPTAFPAQVAAIQTWLHANPTDPDYVTATLTRARDLLSQNAGMTATIIPRTGADCVARPAHAWSYVGHPSKGIQLCDMWFDNDNALCRADVLTHETNHLIGLHKEWADRGNEQTPTDAFDNADTMAQFVNAMIWKSTDNC